MPAIITTSSKPTPVTDLTGYFRNARRGDVEMIKDSLTTLGQYKAIVVNDGSKTGRRNEVLAGNHTLMAAVELGWTMIDAQFVDVDDATARKIVLVDNRTNDVASYDEEALAALLQEAVADDGSLAGTGFSDADLASMLNGREGTVALTDVDAVPDITAEPVTELGDVWLLGPHRIVCGDATEPAVLAALMGDTLADAVWTDPPYGVEYVGKTADALTIDNDFVGGLEALLTGAFQQMVLHASPGAPVYIAHADKQRATFEACAVAAGVGVRQTLIWVKNAMVLGHADYHYRHEPILYGFVTGSPGRQGRGGVTGWLGDHSQTTVFEIDKPSRSETHPTMKPVALIEAQLANSLAPGQTVLDVFGGSGSTLIAAHHMGAQARLVEVDPVYVDVTCRRFQEHTGIVPVVEATGETYDFTATRGGTDG